MVMVLSAAMVVASLSATGASAAPPPPLTGDRERPAGVRHRPRTVDPDVARNKAGTPSPPRTRTRSAGSCSATSRRGAATTFGTCPTARSRRSSPCTPSRRAQWNPSIYDQSIPTNGYGYLTTRDGTKLAIDVHPPTSPAGEPRPADRACHLPSGSRLLAAVPDADRVLRLRLREPRWPDQRHRGAREPHGLRGRRREHARHRLLRRRVRLLRAAPEPRRLRRDRDDRPPALGEGPQGRHDGDLLRRDQPAVHRAAAAAAPRGDLAAVDDRRDRDDALSGRHPQHRLRGRVGATSASTRPCPPDPMPASRGRTSRSRAATPRARPTRSCTPRPRTSTRRSRRTRTTTPRSPTRSTRSRSCTRSRCPTFMACQWEDEQTGGHCPELVRHFTGTSQKWFTFTNGAHIDAIDPDTYNRWYDFLQLFVAHQAPLAERGHHPSRRAGDLPAGDGAPADGSRHVAGRPDPAAADVRPRARRVRTRSRRSGCCSTTARARRPLGTQTRGRPVSRVRAGLRARSPSPARRRAPGTSGRAARSPTTARRPPGINTFTANAHALPLTDFGSNTGTGGLWGNASQWRGTGSRTRPAPPSPTSRHP